MLGLLGWDPYLKTVIAVDDDVDITNDQEVLWGSCHPFPASEILHCRRPAGKRSRPLIVLGRDYLADGP